MLLEHRVQRHDLHVRRPERPGLTHRLRYATLDTASAPSVERMQYNICLRRPAR